MPGASGAGQTKAPKAAQPAAPAAPKGPSPSVGNPTLEALVSRANDEGVSDIHLGVNETPRYRQRGDITTLEEYPVTDLNTFISWMHECMTDEEIRQFQNHLDFDGAYDFGFVRIRINVFDSLAGPAMVLRLIDPNPRTTQRTRSLQRHLLLQQRTDLGHGTDGFWEVHHNGRDD